MKYLIVGLGNVGDEYTETRHNIGFKIIDKLTKDNSVSFVLDRLAFHTEFKYKSRIIHCIKPTTFMNLSGKAVQYWIQKEKIPLENILIIVDDLAIPLGTLRLKAKGSDGGHNGLKNIQQVLGHCNYARLRFGIGSDFNKGQQIDYVLGEWGSKEKELLPDLIQKSIDSILLFVSQGINSSMMFTNQK